MLTDCERASPGLRHRGRNRFAPLELPHDSEGAP